VLAAVVEPEVEAVVLYVVALGLIVRACLMLLVVVEPQWNLLWNTGLLLLRLLLLLLLHSHLPLTKP
jgi:hypothetical protein